MSLGKRQKRLMGVLFLMLLVFSVFVFLVPFRKNGAFWTAYIAGVLSFLLQIPVFKLAGKNAAKLKSRFLGTPLFIAGYIYLGIQTVTSLILMALNTLLNTFPLWISVLICAIILAAALMSSVSEGGAVNRPSRNDNGDIMKKLCLKAENITSMAYDENTRNMLTLVTESLRYCDPDGNKNTRDIEERLKNIISQLGKAVSEKSDITELCAQISALLIERNDICRMSERS